MSDGVDLREIRRVRPVVAEYVAGSPLRHYPGLSRRLGFSISAKLENRNPGGCYKPRGSINALRHVADAGGAGVVTYSTGNHGLSIAGAARHLGLRAVVVVPRGSNPVECRAIADAGAELVEYGATFDDAEVRCIEIADETVIVPLGAGSEASGAVTVLRELKPSVEIIAVQAAASRPVAPMSSPFQSTEDPAGWMISFSCRRRSSWTGLPWRRTIAASCWRARERRRSLRRTGSGNGCRDGR